MKTSDLPLDVRLEIASEKLVGRKIRFYTTYWKVDVLPKWLAGGWSAHEVLTVGTERTIDGVSVTFYTFEREDRR